MTKDSFENIAAEIRTRLLLLSEKNTRSIRAVRREFSKRLANAPSEFVFQLTLLLLKHEKTVPRFFAYELVQHDRQARHSLNSRKLKLLGDGIDSWTSVDTLACYLSGPAWRERQVPDSLIAKWARSRNHWWRRAAVVSTVPLNNKARGGRGDATRTLAICRLVVDDREDMVVKALSWALRELTKRDPGSVKKFLHEKHTHLPRRVVREVNNKLTTGLKNPRKS